MRSPMAIFTVGASRKTCISRIGPTPGGSNTRSTALDRRGLSCHTLNAFPYGDFHSRRVKENVYLPDWADSRRLEYTIDCARILAELLPEGTDGSISTLPLGFKEFPQPSGFLRHCIDNLIQTA